MFFHASFGAKNPLSGLHIFWKSNASCILGWQRKGTLSFNFLPFLAVHLQIWAISLSIISFSTVFVWLPSALVQCDTLISPFNKIKLEEWEDLDLGHSPNEFEGFERSKRLNKRVTLRGKMVAAQTMLKGSWSHYMAIRVHYGFECNRNSYCLSLVDGIISGTFPYPKMYLNFFLLTIGDSTSAMPLILDKLLPYVSAHTSSLWNGRLQSASKMLSPGPWNPLTHMLC